MIRRIGDERIAAVLRVILGGLFLYAGAIKALDARALADDVANYQLLPGLLVPALAAALPWVEMVAGAALIVGRWSRGAALLVAAMMAVFVVALGQAFARGIDLACGCFGGKAPADWMTMARDVVLLAMALYVARFDTGRFGLPLRRDPTPAASQ